LHIPMVDFRDSAIAHLKAMETKLANGKRLIIGNPDIGIESFEAICHVLRQNGFNKVPKMKAPTILIKLMGLFDNEAKGMAPLLGKINRLDSSLTKETLNWEPSIPMEKMVIDLAKSID